MARSGSGPSLDGIGDEPMWVAVGFDLGHRFPDVVSHSACAIDEWENSVDGSPSFGALERVRAFPREKPLVDLDAKPGFVVVGSYPRELGDLLPCECAGRAVGAPELD
ncbi:MAG: hypothetical protein F4Z44_10345 [Gemmatimonadetes bacterium]|nr:hypothetical protein [Gemmatimonadota bacterium]